MSHFKSFTTQELRELVEAICLCPSLDNIDFDECLQAVEELNIREEYMKNLKCYIDVSFTIEEDFSKYTDEEQVEFIENKELMETLFRKDMLERLYYFSDNIRGLQTTITFEGAEED